MRYTLHQREDGSLALFLPPALAQKLLSQNNHRVVLSFGDHRLHCAILRDAVNGHFLRLAKSHHKKWGLQAGSVIDAQIVRDESTYQFQMPESLEEVLDSDPEAMQRWQSLRPGQQRSILYQIAKIKSLDLQIQKSLLLAQRLKDGHTDAMTILKSNG